MRNTVTNEAIATSVRSQSVRWSNRVRNAIGRGLSPLRSAPPKEFDGPGDAWSPEQLLLAAVETCFLFTFRAVARASKFDYASLDLSGSGTVDRVEGTTRFTEIVLGLRLTLPNGGDPERAKRMLEKGKNACLVTASLSVPVRLDSEIVVGPA